ncbi:hypothetical protein BT67DRAFT_52855 [Trichocladium antarcticum]|uniref:Uncharacterized protein n=1 Tax=Trichocladium antarcticum TaxID=1450529 RepID=A0AAN6ZCS8_9PEZI|nr:hypothetical protein BT67DRAFT_52855 [Trichocladium antarcticum]
MSCHVCSYFTPSESASTLRRARPRCPTGGPIGTQLNRQTCPDRYARTVGNKAPPARRQDSVRNLRDRPVQDRPGLQNSARSWDGGSAFFEILPPPQPVFTSVSRGGTQTQRMGFWNNRAKELEKG